jgi:hypothetical protein
MYKVSEVNKIRYHNEPAKGMLTVTYRSQTLLLFTDDPLSAGILRETILAVKPTFVTVPHELPRYTADTEDSET